MTFLLYHEKSQPTGSAIANGLGIGHGIGDTISSGPGLTSLTITNIYGEKVIRWGSRKDYDYNFDFIREINKKPALENASNKLKSLELMIHWGEDDNDFNEENSIRIPDYDVNPMLLQNRVGWPILGRKKYHARGTDIVLCLQEKDLRIQRDFYTEYIPTKREYRIHVAFGEVIRVQGKYRVSRDNLLPHIRNHKSGYVFRTPRLRLRPHRTAMAINAVECLGLDFGAVDLIIGDDDQTYILEVNTAPACSPLTAKAYVEAFANHLEIPASELNFQALEVLSGIEEESDDLEEEMDSYREEDF